MARDNLKTLLLKAQAYEHLRTMMPPKTAAKLLEAPVRLLNKALAVLKSTGSVENALKLSQELGTNDIRLLYAATIPKFSSSNLTEIAFQFRYTLINALQSPADAPHAHRIAYIIYNFLERTLSPEWVRPLSHELHAKIQYLPCTICHAEPPESGNHIRHTPSGTPYPVCPNCRNTEPTPQHLAQYVDTLWSITADLDRALEKLVQQL